jgi:outer membrane protein assembly factor BamA
VPTHELTPLIRTTPSKPFRVRSATADTLDADRGRILSWYRAQGFMAAKVAVAVEEDPDRRRAGVTFRIEEGPQTLVGTIRIEGQHAFDAGTLLAQFDFPPGSPYVEAVSAPRAPPSLRGTTTTATSTARWRRPPRSATTARAPTSRS